MKASILVLCWKRRNLLKYSFVSSSDLKLGNTNISTKSLNNLSTKKFWLLRIMVIKERLTVQKTGRAGRKKNKVCFLEYYGMKYTVRSQNTVFSWMFKTKYTYMTCITQNQKRHKYFVSTFRALPHWVPLHILPILGLLHFFVCYIFITSYLLNKILYSYKVSLDLKIKCGGTEALFNWQWTCREKLTLNTKELIESLFQMVLLT